MSIKDELQKIIKLALEDQLIQGVSYSVIEPQGISMNYVGDQEIDGGEDYKLDPSMLYDLGLMTGSIATATRIFQLINLRRLKLDDIVKKYLPEFNNNKVTINHLLTHTSGLPDELSDYDNLSGLEIIKQIYELSSTIKLGDDVVFSSLNDILLGMVIKNLDGSIDRSVQDNVLYPLAMTNTGYNLNRPVDRFVPTRKDDKRGLIRGQVEDSMGRILNGESGHNGLFSTLSDLTIFVEMMINKGVYHNKEIISGNIFDLLFTINNSGQSLSWKRFSANDDVLFTNSQTGLISFDSVKKRGVVVLTSFVEEELRDRFHRRLLSSYN